MTEVSVSTLLVGLLLVSAGQCVGGAAKSQSRIAERAKAAFLADALVAEIHQQNYMEVGVTASAIGRENTETLTSRSNYDDVDDYDGWTDTPPQNKDGSVMSNLSGWKRTVAVVWVNRTDPTQTSAVETGTKRYTVTVIHNNTTILSRVGIRAKGS